jgi:hypothetical protein
VSRQGDADSASAAPLIVTALLPKDLAAWATALRRAHFPPDRNYLAAHVTLFHALPPQCEDEVRALSRQIAGEFAPVEAALDRVMSLGRGTAFAVESDGMVRLRHRIADHFHGMLTAQDQHTPRLHVTVQNKVSPAEAKALQAELAASFAPRCFAFRGLGLYRYCGGPWDPLGEFAFRGKNRA